MLQITRKVTSREDLDFIYAFNFIYNPKGVEIPIIEAIDYTNEELDSYMLTNEEEWISDFMKDYNEVIKSELINEVVELTRNGYTLYEAMREWDV